MASLGGNPARPLGGLVALFVLFLAGCESRPAEPSVRVTTAEQPIVVEVYTDLVCPFCFIGTERLDRAIAAAGLEDRVLVRHRSFLLRPDTPPEGIDVQAYLRERTGREPAQLFGPVEAMARDSGIELDLSKQPRNHSTVYAHALLHAAEPKGTQRALERAMFRAHFQNAANLADTSVLVSLATAHGFSEEEVRRIVADERALAAVRRESDEGARRGVRGVPFFVFPDGQTISGAQSEAVLRASLERVAR